MPSPCSANRRLSNAAPHANRCSRPVGSAAVSDATAPQLHFIYSRHSARVQALRPAIDAFLDAEKKAAKAAR